MPLTKEGAKLILKGVEILEGIRDDEFDMGSWMKKTLTVSGCSGTANECRTTCCLLGWMTTLPEAKKAGVAFSTKGGWSVPNASEKVAGSNPIVEYDYGFVTVGTRPRKMDNCKAIRKLTGLDSRFDKDSFLIQSLFYDEGSRRDVIERTLGLVHDHHPKIVEAWLAKRAARRKTRKKVKR